MTKSTHIETIAVHAGRRPDPATGAVMPPIHLSTTFERQADGSYTDGYVYSRSENPNRRALEETLAALEGGAAALAFGSGMAATTALLQALAPGDHVIMPDDVYFGTGRLVREVLGQWGLQFSVVDMTDLAAARGAMRPNTRCAPLSHLRSLLRRAPIAPPSRCTRERDCRRGDVSRKSTA